MNIKRGLVFRHTRWLEDDYKTPAACEVTAVRQGTVYYRFRTVNAHRHGKHSIAVEDFPNIVQEVGA